MSDSDDDDDDDTCPYPLVLWKVKVAHNPMAVRAHPRFKLRFKSIKDQAPYHKWGTSRGRGSGWKCPGPVIVPLCSPLFSMDEREMAAVLPMKTRRIMKKIGFSDSD